MTLSLRERWQLKAPLPEKALNESELCDELPKAFGKGEKKKKLNYLYFPGIFRASAVLVFRVSWTSQWTLDTSLLFLSFWFREVIPVSGQEIIYTYTAHLARFLPLKQTLPSLSVENPLTETVFSGRKVNNSCSSSLFVIHKSVPIHL